MSEDGNANTKGQQYFLTFPGPGAISTVLCRAVSVENRRSFLDGLVSLGLLGRSPDWAGCPQWEAGLRFASD